MNLRTLLSFSFGIMVLAGLTGCAHYKARSLRNLRTTGTQLQKQSMSFGYEVYDKSDCKKYLDRDTLAKGYQPIQITFANDTDHRLDVSFNGQVRAQEVAESVHTNTVGRAVGYGVAGFFALPILLIPAVVDGVGSARANEQLDADFDNKALRNQSVNPHSTVNGLIFVPRDSDREIVITAIDQVTNKRYVLTPSTSAVTI